MCALYLLCGGCESCDGAASDHFDGSHFANLEGGDHSFGDMAKWLWQMETVDWPECVEDPPQPPPPERVRPGALRVTHVNHATVLIQIDGLNIITDPIWAGRAGPTSWLGVKRVRSPGVELEQLPPIDADPISHDHLDLPTIKQLEGCYSPRFLVGLGVGAHLRSTGVPANRITELDWWREAGAAGSEVRFVFVPARHGSGRGPFTESRTLWGGWVIDAPDGQVYFASETGHGRFVREIAVRFDRIRLAILPIGNYEERWLMKA